jgi:NADH-quinone oxidoreductase subunit H
LLTVYFNPFFLIVFIIIILGESNRVPFDIPEAESELVAGFITEFSSIYFSLIILAEYASIIAMDLLLIITFFINT